MKFLAMISIGKTSADPFLYIIAM